MISFLGMRLWVFVHRPQKEEMMDSTYYTGREETPFSAGDASQAVLQKQDMRADEYASLSNYSLSVVLPAYNEEQIIASTVNDVLTALDGRIRDFEVIVVNDGSIDHTGEIVERIALADVRVRLVSHTVNQGYGATLVDGFAAATKALTFFMDSDGQFDIHDLFQFFNFIDEYDAVIGYRIDRQDTWIRKLNAWGWKMLVRLVFGLRVGDIDCAFKLYPGKFFHEHRLETRGAMINAEILYKFTRAGYTYTQLGVRHLPRRGGRATGAKLSVILRAFRELIAYAWKWRRAERKKLELDRG